MVLKKVIRWLAAIGVAAAAFWVYREPKPEAWAGLIGAAVAFLGTFVPTPKKGSSTQDQTVSGGSVAVQGGRDVHVGTIKQDKR